MRLSLPQLATAAPNTRLLVDTLRRTLGQRSAEKRVHGEAKGRVRPSSSTSVLHTTHSASTRASQGRDESLCPAIQISDRHTKRRVGVRTLKSRRARRPAARAAHPLSP